MPAATEFITTAGSSLAISAARPTTVTPTAYAALTYTPIGNISDMGTIGRTYNMVKFSPVATRGEQQKKGSYSDGTPAFQMADTPGDPGQVIVNAALDDDNWYSFKQTKQDGTIRYFQAQVTSTPNNMGGVDSVDMVTVNVSVKSGSIKKVLPA